MKRAVYGKEARKGLKVGLDLLANAVKVTLGAKGRPVAIDQPFTIPLVTKDGVTVAESMHLNNPHHNMGVEMVKSVATDTNRLAGDGTSTATVLAQAIVTEGMKSLDKGYNFNEIQKGMEYALSRISAYLEANVLPIKGNYEMMKAVPSISANNNNEIGELIADTFQKVGEHGFISVEESTSSKTYVETAKGLKFKMAPESHLMFQDTIRKTSEIKNSKILLYIGRIESDEEIMPALNLAGNDHILIVCNEINPLLLSRIISTRLQKKINATVVQCPEFGIYRQEAMEDIALVCGAKLFLQEKDDDISKVILEDLGEVQRISMNEEHTSFINPQTENTVEERVAQLLELEQDSDLKERIARLKGGVARIYVGATSELEMREKKDRIVDAVNALTVAYKDGIVPGGGISLMRASQINFEKRNKDFNEGVEIIKKALLAPIKQILHNAGYRAPNFFQRIMGKNDIIKSLLQKEGRIGYDVVAEEETDMVERGIIDPLAVELAALRNAVSVSIVFLSTDCVMIDETNWQEKDIKFADGI